MDIDQVLALYDLQVRAHPQEPPGFVIERAGGVVLITGAFHFVSAWRLSPQAAAEAVAELAARFRTAGQALLWRVHDHDRPAELPGLLSLAGFAPSDPSTLLFLDLADAQGLEPVPGVDVQPVRTLEALDGFMRAQAAAFGEEEHWRRNAYADRLADPDLGLYVAWVDGQPAAAARLEMSPDWSFGLLQGGGVSPEHRRRGLYRALVAARARDARTRGLRYLVTDARETSRPILERLGFVAAGQATLWVLSP
jgi:GNAT superfamily N-acetyltransferase